MDRLFFIAHTVFVWFFIAVRLDFFGAKWWDFMVDLLEEMPDRWVF